ncbi:hypothetical protein COV24_04650 [candidate division WWE3 bacterium CG10_big_fil_rev_8_21_14_0_10_32_10]|uniref:Uncharacterized protein n=1 Tax=candidate division WWE3 bacterium CG10_big_fil_rev_8_21_14_0_10_32_10 TaxID=1975090 RepID=A0A2H0R991_UNCKA|nr:MAG: hypothetical protein COV24_04650 [candidate division WWE3 bacterium CG10_big_fil_rev_8_21_14_0_10_32_10]
MTGIIEEKKDLKNYKTKGYLGCLPFILAFIIVIFFIISKTSYIDLPNLCYIGVEGDLIKGDENSIRASLKYIKNNKPSEYKNVCKYVDSIIESYCISADGRVAPLYGYDQPGCYVKGSKVVYVIPQKQQYSTVVEDRAKNIIKYANYSKDFWTK